ncbi:Uncharacterized protein pbN1_27260 [Aromatoleum bremense]|nr:Uncharacterized protein pbN1_27260 [Aromatoleum bremense]
MSQPLRFVPPLIAALPPAARHVVAGDKRAAAGSFHAFPG